MAEKKKGHPPIIDRRGVRYGRLTVVDRAPNRFQAGGRSIIMWNCVCECGEKAVVQSDRLSSGKTQSCGCLNRETTSKHRRKYHSGFKGINEHRKEYVSWMGARVRVLGSKSPKYHNYGGRGIRMCERWLNSFEAFLYDMGPSPKGTSIDRIDNNGNYEPGNCRWATSQEQQRNRRVTVLISIGTLQKTAAEWAEVSGVPADRISSRIKRGWEPERAVFVSVKKGPSRASKPRPLKFREETPNKGECDISAADPNLGIIMLHCQRKMTVACQAQPFCSQAIMMYQKSFATIGKL
jgi:hypothetical protein